MPGWIRNTLKIEGGPEITKPVGRRLIELRRTHPERFLIDYLISVRKLNDMAVCTMFTAPDPPVDEIKILSAEFPTLTMRLDFEGCLDLEATRGARIFKGGAVVEPPDRLP